MASHRGFVEGELANEGRKSGERRALVSADSRRYHEEVQVDGQTVHQRHLLCFGSCSGEKVQRHPEKT